MIVQTETAEVVQPFLFCMLWSAFFIYSIPTASARNQPIGIADHIPTTPIAGTGESTYASKTLVPSDIIVSTSDISGFSIPR